MNGLKYTILYLLFTVLINVDLEALSKEGETLYQASCFACHGKTLEGGIGFNLKDGHWVHGSSKSQIVANIKKGFPSKGMPPFEQIFSDEQIDNITDYLLSKKEGLRDLNFRVYEVDDPFKQLTTGKLHHPFIDIFVSNQKNFKAVYHGVLHIPKTDEYQLTGTLTQNSGLSMKINDVPIDFVIEEKKVDSKIKLLKGSHKFELTYERKIDHRNLLLQLESDETLIPLSKASHTNMLNSIPYEVNASMKPLVMRKRIEGLAPGSIAIAFPEKVNFAINPQTASLNAFWRGDFLNIGPNIKGRGENAALHLGNSILGDNKEVKILINNKPARVKFIKYTTLGPLTFYFNVNGKSLSIQPYPNSKGLSLIFNSEIIESISFEVPNLTDVMSDDGEIIDGILKINPDFNHKFSLSVGI